jgi:hypothetical protein
LRERGFRSADPVFIIPRSGSVFGKRSFYSVDIVRWINPAYGKYASKIPLIIPCASSVGVERGLYSGDVVSLKAAEIPAGEGGYSKARMSQFPSGTPTATSISTTSGTQHPISSQEFSLIEVR